MGEVLMAEAKFLLHYSILLLHNRTNPQIENQIRDNLDKVMYT